MQPCGAPVAVHGTLNDAQAEKVLEEEEIRRC